MGKDCETECPGGVAHKALFDTDNPEKAIVYRMAHMESSLRTIKALSWVILVAMVGNFAARISSSVTIRPSDAVTAASTATETVANTSPGE